jgi:hypothetical protein
VEARIKEDTEKLVARKIEAAQTIHNRVNQQILYILVRNWILYENGQEPRG